MQANHTPGPWAFIRRYPNNSGTILGPDGGSVCAIASNVRRYPEEKAANAALLTAAPDLLENLRQLAELLESIGHDCTPAREVIARATGEV